MIVNNVSLNNVAVKKSQYPKDNKSEIAFVGKSNVGKSSLINTMINRKALARTSKSPGKTRTINFYNIEDLFYFVDLPGYGYAKISKTELKNWKNMIESYLLERKELKMIIMLVDIRHKPSDNDKIMHNFLSYYNYKRIIVATKSDKLKKNQIKKNLCLIKKELNLKEEDILLSFSSANKDGFDNLWEIIKKEIFL